MEGADGAAQIKALANAYSEQPPAEVDGSAVVRVRDFSNDDHEDSEGDTLPKEGMIIIELADGRSYAVRPSGTEPKIKFYLFGKDAPGAADLSASKEKVSSSLEGLWLAIDADAKLRMS